MYLHLRRARKEKGIPAQEMAELLGLQTKAAYYKKETGATKFTLDEARLVADMLGMPIEKVFPQTYDADGGEINNV